MTEATRAALFGSSPSARIDSEGPWPYTPPLRNNPTLFAKRRVMKVRSSLKSLKTRHRDCKLVRRKGRVYIINKTNPRFKAKQG